MFASYSAVVRETTAENSVPKKTRAYRWQDYAAHQWCWLRNGAAKKYNEFTKQPVGATKIVVFTFRLVAAFVLQCDPYNSLLIVKTLRHPATILAWLGQRLYSRLLGG